MHARPALVHWRQRIRDVVVKKLISSSGKSIGCQFLQMRRYAWARYGQSVGALVFDLGSRRREVTGAAELLSACRRQSLQMGE